MFQFAPPTPPLEKITANIVWTREKWESLLGPQQAMAAKSQKRESSGSVLYSKKEAKLAHTQKAAARRALLREELSAQSKRWHAATARRGGLRVLRAWARWHRAYTAVGGPVIAGQRSMLVGWTRLKAAAALEGARGPGKAGAPKTERARQKTQEHIVRQAEQHQKELKLV